MTKVCPKCKVEKDLEEGFYKRTLPSGTVTNQGWCKACTNELKKSRQRAAYAALKVLEGR